MKQRKVGGKRRKYGIKTYGISREHESVKIEGDLLALLGGLCGLLAFGHGGGVVITQRYVDWGR